MKKPIVKRKRPTIKQRRLVRAITENYQKKGKPKPMGALMLEAGYSKESSKEPNKILNSPTFIQLLDDVGFTDKEIAKQLSRGLKLKSNALMAYMVRHKYIETGLKLRKHTNQMGDEAIDALKGFVQIYLPPHDPLPTK